MSIERGEFQTSATYIGAIVRALKELKQFEAVVSKSEPNVARMMRSPNTQPWWGSTEAFALTHTIAAVGGTALVQRVGELAVSESMSHVIRPVIALIGAVFGPSPATLISRFGQLSKAAINNVAFVWKATSDTSGELTITYPLPVPPEMAVYWLGAFDFVWARTKKVGKAIATYNGASVHFAVSWDAK